MIKPECLNELKEFLTEYPRPRLVTATTIHKGHASCIRPIKTICGAEVMCHPETASDVRKLIY